METVCRNSPVAQHAGALRIMPARLNLRLSSDSSRQLTCPDCFCPRRRTGLTLLEILLATAILTAALAALSQQSSNSVSAALRTQLETEAALHCQSILNRLSAEGVPLTDITEQPIQGQPAWRWSLSRTASQFDGATILTISVHRTGIHEKISRFQLSRLIRDKLRDLQ